MLRLQNTMDVDKFIQMFACLKSVSPGLPPRLVPRVLQLSKFACYTTIYGATIKETFAYVDTDMDRLSAAVLRLVIKSIFNLF